MRAATISHRMYGLADHDARRQIRPAKRRKTRAEYEEDARGRVERYKRQGWV